MSVKPAPSSPRADRLDHAVHHPRGGDHVGPRAGVADRLLGQERQGRVVVDVHPPAPLGQRSAVAVVGVLAEAEVGDHEQLGRVPLGQPDRLLDDPRLVRRRRAVRILVLGNAEQQDRRDAQLGDLGHRLAEAIERELILPRHRRDLAPEVRAVIDEQRVNQVVHRQPMLADEVAEPGVPAEPAKAMERVAGGGLIRHRKAIHPRSGAIHVGGGHEAGHVPIPGGSHVSLTQPVAARRARDATLRLDGAAVLGYHAARSCFSDSRGPRRSGPRGRGGSDQSREGPPLSAIGTRLVALVLGLAGPTEGAADLPAVAEVIVADLDVFDEPDGASPPRTAPTGRPGHRPGCRSSGLAGDRTSARLLLLDRAVLPRSPAIPQGGARVTADRAIVRSGHPQAKMPGVPRVVAERDGRPAPRSRYR